LPKKSDKLYGASSLILLGIIVLASLVTLGFPRVSSDLRASMFDNLIRLDGILFGFSAVMLGLFFRDLAKMSERTAFSCLVFIMVSFFGYIISIGASFIGMANSSPDSFPSPYFCLALTISSLACSSIYILMILVDEYYPPEKPK
jgi:hypothetical protein